MFDEEERKASEEYIQQLLAEEEQLLQAERKRREEDERMARLLSDQLVSVLRILHLCCLLVYFMTYIFIFTKLTSSHPRLPELGTCHSGKPSSC